MNNYFLVNQNNNKDNNTQHGTRRIGTYISPSKQTKQHNEFNANQNNCLKNSTSQGHDALPPRVPFRRSRNSSRDKADQTQQYTSAQHRCQSYTKTTVLVIKLNQQIAQKQKLKILNATLQEKIKMLTCQIEKINQQKQSLACDMLKLKQQFLQGERNLQKANQNIQVLNKNFKESKINQKSLTNLKNIQSQLDLLQQKNTKLMTQNEQLSKNNRKLKNELYNKKDSTSESQVEPSKSEEKIKSLEFQIRRLKQELLNDHSQRQILLENNIRNLEAKLYQKQHQIKKMSIQMNFIDRKKYNSIDEVKTKKDQQIKNLRQKFMKVSRDLKETKDKIEQNQKKKNLKNASPYIRKAKSSKVLGVTSQSQQLTFQLSSQR